MSEEQERETDRRTRAALADLETVAIWIRSADDRLRSWRPARDLAERSRAALADLESVAIWVGEADHRLRLAASRADLLERRLADAGDRLFTSVALNVVLLVALAVVLVLVALGSAS